MTHHKELIATKEESIEEISQTSHANHFIVAIEVPKHISISNNIELEVLNLFI